MSQFSIIPIAKFFLTTIAILIVSSTCYALTVFTDRQVWENAASGPPDISENFNSISVDTALPIDLGNLSLFTSGPDAIIDAEPFLTPFEGLPEDSVVDGTTYLRAPINNQNVSNEQITVTFVQPVFSLGLDLNPHSGDLGDSIQFITDSGEIGVWVIPTTDVTEFRGLVSNDPFSSLTFSFNPTSDGDWAEAGWDNLAAHIFPDAITKTTIAGVKFDHNAFVDILISSNPTSSIPFTYPIDPSLYVAAFGIVGDATNIEDAVIGDDISTAAGSWAENGFLELGFTDNLLINGMGNDLVLFELGSSIDSFGVSLEPNGQVIEYSSVFTGYYTRTLGINGFVPINVAFVDLDDFGVPVGSSISHFYIGGLDTLTTLSVAGALNSTPPGDLDLDNDLDGKDLHAFIIAYSNNTYPKADINGDGIIDLEDIKRFAQEFGRM